MPPAQLYRRVRTTDRIWIGLAQTLGFRVTRSAESWVSYDGAGTINISPDDELDADDCVAQILLHELCHWLVQGFASREAADWGLDNTSTEHEVYEHAALRLQAAIADSFGLRRVLVATTDFRPYYESLSSQPLSGQGEASEAARAGWERYASWERRADLEECLDATRRAITTHDPP